jgi:hypothetical protein
MSFYNLLVAFNELRTAIREHILATACTTNKAAVNTFRFSAISVLEFGQSLLALQLIMRL